MQDRAGCHRQAPTSARDCSPLTRAPVRLPPRTYSDHCSTPAGYCRVLTLALQPASSVDAAPRFKRCRRDVGADQRTASAAVAFSPPPAHAQGRPLRLCWGTFVLRNADECIGPQGYAVCGHELQDRRSVVIRNRERYGHYTVRRRCRTVLQHGILLQLWTTTSKRAGVCVVRHQPRVASCVSHVA